MDDNTEVVVKARLGAAAARLHVRLAQIRDAAQDRYARAALRTIILESLCGAFHDHRSESPTPKADLVRMLRDVPGDKGAAPLIKRLIPEIDRGAFAEDAAEGERAAERAAALKLPKREADILTPGQARLLRYFLAVYGKTGKAPTVRAAAHELDLSVARVAQLLTALTERGFLRHDGRTRHPTGKAPT